ncbi:ribose transport system ATP-binding protein [Pseudoxanthobacter soli DSM 19599]|uniref:Ribose transport system ATP-binding protein n=1 Tax=Pseudoxanthobacter soli DSM 19599 TaxID=1123029 RepID=A0A1M7ZM22_9HYPH|nr:sugar ABC transporter ATP-binding protein [Pseudoxanthobacter soli]SHO65953.1 ribose transport system ATP-binding protein [Pseudoxanthobacter soli DSM 19599]
MSKSAIALEMRDITKSFPGVRALEAVSFECAHGEVHAICGENGAGKSTLIKVLGGIYRPDAGAIFVEGKPAVFSHPVEARRAGISIIHQELSLLPHRTVAENIYLGLEPTRRGRLDRKAMAEGARRLLDRLGASIHTNIRAGELAIAEQQTVEIAKALALDARILIMDEPTAALDDANAKRLLDLIARLRSEGVAIVYVSHRMPEIAAIADRVTVMKDGRNVETAPIADMPTERIVRLMVGRALSDYYPARPQTPPGAVLLEVAGGGNAELTDIELRVHAGEIVGIAGLEGSGKAALARAIFGDGPFTRGGVRFLGEPVDLRHPRAGISAGIGYLSDDRKREGCLIQQSLRDNLLLVRRAFAGAARGASAGSLADVGADEMMRRLDVRAADFGQAIGALSGGNQQKVILGRWLARDPRLLIFCEPTRGIDVAAKAAIYRLMRDVAARGRGVVMVSSDLPEVIGVSDRILVMHQGHIAGECSPDVGEEGVMALAVGHLPSPAPLSGEGARA